MGKEHQAAYLLIVTRIDNNNVCQAWKIDFLWWNESKMFFYNLKDDFYVWYASPLATPSPKLLCMGATPKSSALQEPSK